jgi:UDP-glucose 4-epimerase
VAGTALVTGGAGFIGSRPAELLLDDGVSALDDLSTGSESNLFHIYRNPYVYLSVESVLATSVVSELVHGAERPGHTLLSVGVG